MRRCAKRCFLGKAFIATNAGILGTTHGALAILSSGAKLIQSVKLGGILRILGVDPGTATTGYGVIELVGQSDFDYLGAGIIRTTNEYCQSERLKMIRADMVELLNEYRPDILAIESIFFFKNAKTIVPVAQARGVILEAAASGGVATVEYTPMQVKMTIAGYGRADKKQMQAMVAKLLGSSTVIKPDDASDAVAIAICHARSHTMPTARQSTA